MRPDQSSAAKRMDLSGLPIMLEAEIIRFIKGVRGPRENLVSLAQIQKWCSGTPKESVAHTVGELVYKDKVAIYRTGLGRSRCGYVYEVKGSKA